MNIQKLRQSVQKFVGIFTVPTSSFSAKHNGNTAVLHNTEPEDYLLNPDQHIYLIGMMGCWKSTIGHQLAKEIGLKFLDTDVRLEAAMKMPIPDIFRYFGEERFRREETRVLRDIAFEPGCVVATGGGIIVTEINRRLLRETGLVIMLQAAPEILAQRIKSTYRRPLLHRTKDVKARLLEIWTERKEYYLSTADYVVDTDQKSVPELVDMIVSRLKDQYENH